MEATTNLPGFREVYGFSNLVNIDYSIESATYGFLFTSCKTSENERVSAANE